MPCALVMYLMNDIPFYIQDQLALADINQTLESVISTCHDIDIHLNKMIRTTKTFVDRYSINPSFVTSKFDDDIASSNVCNSHFVPLINTSLPDNVVLSHDTRKSEVPFFIIIILIRRYHLP